MILITCDAVYIGSHTAIDLLRADYEITIVDNFVNSSSYVIDKISLLSVCNFSFHDGNVNDKNLLSTIFYENDITDVTHLADLRSVSE